MIETMIIGFPNGDIDSETQCTRDDVAEAFSEYRWSGSNDKRIDISYAEIHAGYYTYESYSGDAFVLFRDTRDGKWYEVNGSHCSCFGLEDQWRPELVSTEAMKMRSFNVDGVYRLRDDEDSELNRKFKSTVLNALEGVDQRVNPPSE